MIKTTDTRPGFMVFYEDWEVAMQLMEPKDFHEFFTAAFNYARNGELPDAQQHEKMFNVFFDNMRSKLDRDEQRYHQRIEQSRHAGKKSAAKRALTQREQQRQVEDEEYSPEEFEEYPPEEFEDHPSEYYFDPEEPPFPLSTPTEETETVQLQAQNQTEHPMLCFYDDGEPCDIHGNPLTWDQVREIYGEEHIPPNKRDVFGS